MSAKKAQKTVLAWLDLETTGLDEKSGRILEYAMVCTHVDLTDILYMSKIIPQNVGIARAMMDDYVVDMHTKNGLLAELEAAEGNALQYADSIEQAEEELIQMLNAVTLAVGGNMYEIIFVIAGANPGFDKDWVEEHMPNLFKQLHYRQLDVNTYKVGMPDSFDPKSSVAHRAMADIRESIAHQSGMLDIVEKAWRYDQLDR